jgi:peptide deformylase
MLMSEEWPPAELLDILIHPNDTLRQRAEEVSSFDSSLRDLARCMQKTIERSGVGLAAPQVGVSRRLIVVETPELSLALANPVILGHSTRLVSIPEGCLSCPGVEARVKRWDEIVVSGYDLHGTKRSFGLTMLNAIVFQHELDHLDGKLIVDQEAVHE